MLQSVTNYMNLSAYNHNRVMRYNPVIRPYLYVRMMRNIPVLEVNVIALIEDFRSGTNPVPFKIYVDSFNGRIPASIAEKYGLAKDALTNELIAI